MRKTKDYGYIKVGVPEELLDEFRHQAQTTGMKITDVAHAFFTKMLADQIKFDQPIEVTVSVKNIDISQLKLLAGRSNMNVKQYVHAYYNKSLTIPNEV